MSILPTAHGSQLTGSEFADKIDDVINAIAIDSIITDKYIDKEFGI